MGKRDTAYDKGRATAAATVANRTKEVKMLDCSDDPCLLWDILVDDQYKHQGAGSKLLKRPDEDRMLE